MRRLGIGLAASLVLAAFVAGAQEPSLPPAPTRHFDDRASLVDAGTAARVEEKLRQFEQATSTQIVVSVFPELPSPSLEDFTSRTAQAWRIGRKGLDNGAVLFVFVKDRAVRIEAGYGLEGALPDATAKRIIEEVILPEFRQGRFGAGLEAGADAMMAATRGEYTAPAVPAQGARRRSSGASILGFVAILLFINFILGRNMSRGRYSSYSRRGRRRGWGGPVIWGGGGGWGGGGFGGGGGGFGGGGFSGGGGSFGGGGASGRW